MLKPLATNHWSFSTAAHLLNRAGFGGPPAEIERLAALGPEAAVARLVDYESVPDPTPAPAWAQPDLGRAERLQAARRAGPEAQRQAQREEQREQRRRLFQLRGWWLERMVRGPRPLQERMVLFWHGHFATSFVKVRDAYLMWRQNDLFRRLATGSWPRLLIETAKDPAMLLWLDQAQSRKEHPNENFAREVMELFALGEGHYCEQDVTEGARALTGWSYERATQRFVERPNWHDPGPKSLFGRTGNYDGEGFLRAVVAQPQAARFILARLWLFFAGAEPSDALVDKLTTAFRRSDDSFKPVLREMFLSEAFYAPELIRSQVKSPVQWLVGSVRVLERELPPPIVCADLLQHLGQELFAPPNVKGWDGGLSWISTNTLLARYNEAATLLGAERPAPAKAGRDKPSALRRAAARALRSTPTGTVDVGKLFPARDRAGTEALIAAVERRLLQGRLKPAQAAALRDYLQAQEPLSDLAVLHALRLVMSTPEYQLT